MGNNDVVLEWIKFEKSDLDTAKYLFETIFDC